MPASYKKGLRSPSVVKWSVVVRTGQVQQRLDHSLMLGDQDFEHYN